MTCFANPEALSLLFLKLFLWLDKVYGYIVLVDLPSQALQLILYTPVLLHVKYLAVVRLICDFYFMYLQNFQKFLGFMLVLLLPSVLSFYLCCTVGEYIVVQRKWMDSHLLWLPLYYQVDFCRELNEWHSL